MAKKRVTYVCLECGYTSPGWLGKCPSCGTWGSLSEQSPPPAGESGKRTSKGADPVKLSEISVPSDARIETGIGEFDRVAGGGLVRGGCVLLAGSPGVGKSTLLLQVASRLAERGERVLYVSGEESAFQVKLRAERLGAGGDEIYLLPETSVESILSVIEEVSPSVVIVDSVQTLSTETAQGLPGSVSQVRESTALLVDEAKRRNLPLILVGHVTKEGVIAGPKLLEHMVDAVFQFDGEKGHPYRVLRAAKNRFGSVSEVGVFEMTGSGLAEVSDPSGIFAGSGAGGVPGMVVYPALQGMRTLLVEVQALVSRSYLPVPRRVSVGVDLSRSQILSTIVEKYCGVSLAGCDLFLNVAGGWKIADTGADLALVSAILSGALDVPVPSGFTCFGEVGLGG
ncbi:MAG: DNA repair protein RadA, partial [Deltaproteobacteria bacterium]